MASRTLGGRYTVQDKIGTGGMAIVYRGVDDVLGRTVAIKTMLPQYANDQSFAARFKQEAQAAAALQSPYIVAVYDWGKDSDTYYIIMEYLRGTDLKSGIRKHGALDCRKVAQIGSQIAQALTVAHRHDIIHRDIKPQNIMVQPDGNIKVMDFGIARAKNSHLTADNSVLGTAHYVSPEQTQGKDLGPTTDIYSLGIVMYEAATGRVPFDGDDAISVALKQVNDPPLPPSQINPHVDAALESIILKCMQKSPDDRFQSAEELNRVLRDYLAGKMQAVNDATSTIGAGMTANRKQRTSGRGFAGQHTDPNVTGEKTGSHYRAMSATEENLDRRHKRNVIVGAIATVAVLTAIAIAAFLLLGRTKTHNVPNFIGLTQEDAVAQIEQLGYFTVGPIKEQYSNKVAKGEVVDQNPDPGNSAAEGSAIELVISKGEEPAKEVTVPELIGKSPSEAEAALREVGLKGQAGDSIFSDDVENGNVAAQDPKANATAKAGDTVTYQLSKGGEPVEVPNVIGWSQSEARSALENEGFSVIVTNAANEEYAAGMVCAQSPTGHASRGSEVTITISSGSAKTDVEIPYVTYYTENEAKEILTSAGFNVYTVEEASSAAAGTVIRQNPSGTAEKGTTVTIYVSTGSGGDTDNNTNNNTNNNNNNNNGNNNNENNHENGNTDTEVTVVDGHATENTTNTAG